MADSSSRPAWLSVVLALLPVVSLVVCYMVIFESQRTGHRGYNELLVFGSPMVVGSAAGLLCTALSPAGPKRMKRALCVGLSVGLVYLYLLMFIILNTLGS